METEEPRLPSYNEALELGVAPPPRPQWAPPRVEEPSSPRPWSARPRSAAYRALSMSTIDEAAHAHGSRHHLRPRTAAARPARPSSLLEIGLDAVLIDALARDANSNNSSLLPVRPSTSQGFRSHASSRTSASSSSRLPPLSTTRSSSYSNNNESNNTNTNSNSDNDGDTPSSRPTTPSFDDPPQSPAYTVVPDALPQHVRPLVPPTYARHDPIARTYLMRSPLVYSTTGSSPQTPAFHLDAHFGKHGRPYQLRIRPLDHLESRTLSLSRHAAHHNHDGDQQNRGGAMMSCRGSLEYDDDHTLYLLQVMQLLGGFGVPGFGFGPSWRVEMQRDPGRDGAGGASGSGHGIIRFEGGGFLGTGKGFMQRSACKFWYMTRRGADGHGVSGQRGAGPQLRTAHEWKLINKYGWQPELEWNKRLMFTVEKKRGVVGKTRNRGYEWRDGKGRLVALESAEGRLDLTGIASSMSAQSREALLACWVGKAWAGGALTW